MSANFHFSTLAGSFYPSSKQELSVLIEQFLSSVKISSFQSKPQILIVPHAGYIYSGQTAAYGYKAVQGQKYERVIVIAPAHQNLFRGIVLSNFDSWDTPLAKIKLDKKFARKLVDTADHLLFNPEVFCYENALEVQLPFLQTVLPKVRIVPVLVGQVSNETIEQFAFDLFRFIDDQSLVIISSDLSHYPDYETANRIDRETIEAIIAGDVGKFEEAMQDIMNRKIAGLDTCACGQDAIKVGLILADYLGISQNWQLLHYFNSGDISGDKGQVVGYASILCTTERKSNQLFKNEQDELLAIAESSLQNHLKYHKLSKIELVNKYLYKPMGVFVTLKNREDFAPPRQRRGRRSQNKGQLRGCIGYPEPVFPLYLAIQKAVVSATQDSRFEPVTLLELSNIDIEISVLSPLRKISDIKKIVLGKHGVVVKRDDHYGLFLSQVAQETGWDLETFLTHLCQDKAGLDSEAWKDKETEIYIFTVQIIS